ncbi:MAG: outer membrane lipoprotein-sorting protein [Verrucomicrobia bacterium]|nr:outer membrane lipoprotein-sorting protein [Verrucomicrobiota bacterium]MCH8510528.1 outer membrane lipoprotein-sorting protein [Kiritimatiellia bacterium]
MQMLRFPIFLGLLGLAFGVVRADAEPETGQELMWEVRARLPPMPLRLTGFIRTREGRRNIDRALVSELRFGEVVPHMRFELADGFGETLTTARISWPEGTPHFQQWDAEGEPIPETDPADEIAETGLTWSDLSLDFLWWEGAEITGRERIKTRPAHVVEIPAPESHPHLTAVRLWIDTSALFIVRAQLIGPEGANVKRIDVDSIVEVREGMWMVKDLIIRDQKNNRRMGIRFEDVEELEE